MHQALLFRCRERAGDLQGDLYGSQHVERSCPANTHFQRFAFHQFHRAEALPVFFADSEVINRRNIWMPQRRRDPCFAHEPFARFRSLLHPFRINQLQRDWSLQRSVHRPIGHSHGATAKLPRRAIGPVLDPVIPESLGYGSDYCVIEFLLVVEPDAQQTNHAAPKTAGKTSL